ncbi:MAG: hypothetical protein R3C69_17600 [Geminicoccaceae bacterium]
MAGAAQLDEGEDLARVQGQGDRADPVELEPVQLEQGSGVAGCRRPLEELLQAAADDHLGEHRRGRPATGRVAT